MYRAGGQDYGYISIADFEAVIEPMWDTKDAMYAVMLSLMRYRGFGPSETCILRLQNVMLDQVLYYRPKTGYKRFVHLPKTARTRLDWWIRNNKHRFYNGYLFTSLNSNHEHVKPNTLTKKFRKYMEKAGIDCSVWRDPNPGIPNAGRNCYMIRCYDLRSSCATDYYLASGKDLVATATFLGHKDVRQVIKYVRLAAILEERKVMDRMFEKPIESVTQSQTNEHVIT